MVNGWNRDGRSAIALCTVSFRGDRANFRRFSNFVAAKRRSGDIARLVRRDGTLVRSYLALRGREKEREGRIVLELMHFTELYPPPLCDVRY